MIDDFDTDKLERATAEAIARLEREGFPLERTSLFQLKIRHVNFYPSTGRITIDGSAEKVRAKGLDALVSILKGGRRR